MPQNNLNDRFIFLYELEPSELCDNFRFDTKPVWTADYPPRNASFAAWQNMLAVFYNVQRGTKNFEGVRGEADYIATGIITSYSFLTGKVLGYSPRNWVEFETDSPISKAIVGKFGRSQPPVGHKDNEILEQVAKLMALILQNAPLARALDDFRSCLSKTDPDFYVFAYRAVEDIRSHFDSSKDSDRKQAWNRMNKALNRKEEDYSELVGYAEQYRHAKGLGETIDPKDAQRQVTFVGSLISDFIKHLSNPQ